ncbi:hypothetical protein J6590_025111 [Homalodisca vitripennis]|nr:hypothetical protein J6590_025111 [Homalodisca vitripennis]
MAVLLSEPLTESSIRVLVEGKILGSRHRHANDTNLHEKVSLAAFFNRRLGRGLLTCMKKSYENRLRKSVTFTASSRDLKVKPMSYNSLSEDEAITELPGNHKKDDFLHHFNFLRKLTRTSL